MRRRAPLAAALAASALLLTACSGGDGATVASRDGTSTTGPTSTTTTGETTTTAAPAPSTTAAPPTTRRTVPAQAPADLAVLEPGDPSTVAASLAASEAAIRDPAVAVGDLESQGRAQQVAYRQLAAHPEWLGAVLDKLPAALHDVVRANVGAGVELRALTAPKPTLPDWRIVAPPPASELLGYYKEAEAGIGVPWTYLASIHLVETRMGRIRGASTAGALGPMQFLPSTWAQYGNGGDINSSRDAILAAARLLARNGAPTNMANALLAYNRSQHYVSAVTAYARQMAAEERAYFGYYHWQVYYRMPDGDRLLPVGYGT